MSTEDATTPAAVDAASAAATEVAATAPAQSDDIDTSNEDRMPNPDADADDPGEGDDPNGADASAGDPADPAKKDTAAEGLSAEDLVEVEYAEGKTVKIPKELQRGFLREDDYTRKTQALAESRKGLETQQAQLAELAEVGKALIQEHAKVTTLEARVQHYAKVDWDALNENDPDRHNLEWRRYQESKDALTAAKTDLTAKETTHLASQREAATAAHATARKEMVRDLAEQIPDLNQQTLREIAQHALDLGLTTDELEEVTDARLLKMIHGHMTANRTLSAKDQEIAALKAQLAKHTKADTHARAQSAAPAAATSGNAKPTAPSDAQGTAGWMARRQAEIDRRRASR